AEHGEPQVIADQRTNAQPPPWDAPGRAPGREVLVLAAHAEQVPLVVMAGSPRGRHPQQAVVVTAALLRDEAGGDRRLGPRGKPRGPRRGRGRGGPGGVPPLS